MSHLPLWYLGQLNPELCDRAIGELQIKETADATMWFNGPRFR